jgi:MFS family permease
MTEDQPSLKEPIGRWARLVHWLGLQRSLTAVLAMAVLVGLGEKMAERFLPVYLIALGGGALSVGLLNGMDNLLSALYAFPGGYLSDRLGYKRALVIFNLLAVGGYLIVIFIPHWSAVLIGAVLFLSWTAISLPATMDLVSKVLPRNQRTMGVSLHSLVRRIPMALGPVIGGALIGLYGEVVGVRAAFIAALGLAVVSLFIQQAFIEEDRTVQFTKRSNFKLSLSPALRRLLVSDILVRFCEQIPYAFVVLWCLTVVGVTPLQFGILTAIEMATAMLVYIPVAYLADRSTKKPFVTITFGFFTLFPLFLSFSRSFGMLVAAFVIRGLKEFGEPTRKALIMDLAPEGRKAAGFGLYYLIRDVVVSVAAFGGALLWDGSAAQDLSRFLGIGEGLAAWLSRVASPQTNLMTAFGFGVLGTLIFLLAGRDLEPGQGSA